MNPLRTPAIRAALLAFTLPFAPGCVRDLESLVQDPSFTFSDAKSGHLLVGGAVVSATLVAAFKPEDKDASADPGSSPPLSSTDERETVSLLLDAINDERPAIHARALRTSATDDGFHQRVVDDVGKSGGMSTTTLKEAKAKLATTARYLAVIRIEGDARDRARSSTTERETDSKGNETASYYLTLMEATRTVTTRLLIYDLPAERLVWEGVASDTVTETNDYKRKEHKAFLADLGASIVDDVVNSKNFPEYPDRLAVLDISFIRFAHFLPDE